LVVRAVAEASAAAASYSQSLRAKTVELEATKTVPFLSPKLVF
jgi:hypothetical protein